MRRILRLLPLLAVCLLLGGCRFKGWESFTSATGAPDPAVPNPVVAPKGDPYSFGSEAVASGGLKAETNYGAGASLTSTGKLNPIIDQPEQGSGQQAGQYSSEAAPGYAQDNGPSLQPQPGTMTDDATLAHG
jgi:hypothetical protein